MHLSDCSQTTMTHRCFTIADRHWMCSVSTCQMTKNFCVVLYTVYLAMCMCWQLNRCAHLAWVSMQQPSTLQYISVSSSVLKALEKEGISSCEASAASSKPVCHTAIYTVNSKPFQQAKENSNQSASGRICSSDLAIAKGQLQYNNYLIIAVK